MSLKSNSHLISKNHFKNETQVDSQSLGIHANNLYFSVPDKVLTCASMTTRRGCREQQSLCLSTKKRFKVPEANELSEHLYLKVTCLFFRNMMKNVWNDSIMFWSYKWLCRGGVDVCDFLLETPWDEFTRHCTLSERCCNTEDEQQREQAAFGFFPLSTSRSFPFLVSHLLLAAEQQWKECKSPTDRENDRHEVIRWKTTRLSSYSKTALCLRKAFFKHAPRWANAVAGSVAGELVLIYTRF